MQSFLSPGQYPYYIILTKHLKYFCTITFVIFLQWTGLLWFEICFSTKICTSYLLIHLTDKRREQRDSGNLAWLVFITLQNRFRYATIISFNYSFEQMCCGISEGCLLEPAMYLIYINDLYCAIRHCPFYQFADDSTIVIFQWK